MKANKEREKIRLGLSLDEALQRSIDEYLVDDRKGKGKAVSSETLDPDSLDGKLRWMRVNELKWTTEEAVEWLLKENWGQCSSLEELAGAKGWVGSAQNICLALPKAADLHPYRRNFAVDAHIPNLLAFPIHSLTLAKFAPYTDARFIAQDKASCMPAYLLLNQADDDAADTVVIDATSAPGNKTSYAAASLSRLQHASEGPVYAFERDDQRYKILRRMLGKAGCRRKQSWITAKVVDNRHFAFTPPDVTAVHADFLQVDPLEAPYSEATHILVDPSCCTRRSPILSSVTDCLTYIVTFIAGSGIHANDDASDPGALQARLTPLSQFQRHILAHALRFPNARKVVYSTCSVHREEDENVVLDTIGKKEFRKVWRVQRRESTLPDWPLRGVAEDGNKTEECKGMIRCERRLGTHGFFVTVLVKRPNKEEETGRMEEDEGAEDEVPAHADPEADENNHADFSDPDSGGEEAENAGNAAAMENAKVAEIEQVPKTARTTNPPESEPSTAKRKRSSQPSRTNGQNGDFSLLRLAAMSRRTSGERAATQASGRKKRRV